jgi:hypothetical protein
MRAPHWESRMIAAILLALSLSAATGCPLEKSHYALRGSPFLTADFRDAEKSADWPVGMLFSIHSGQTGRTTGFSRTAATGKASSHI